MTLIERRLCLAGAILFLFGLILGFAVPAFADTKAVLNAHLTALGSGTFLIAIGLLWRKLDFSPKWSSIFAHMLWTAFYILQAGLTLAATSKPAAASAPLSTAQALAGVLNIIGAILMAIAVAGVVVALVKLKPTTES